MAAKIIKKRWRARAREELAVWWLCMCVALLRSVLLTVAREVQYFGNMDLHGPAQREGHHETGSARLDSPVLPLLQLSLSVERRHSRSMRRNT